MPVQLSIDVPSDFNFKTAVYGHGWCDLRPFKLDLENWILSYVFSPPDAFPFSASIHESGGGIIIKTDAAVADRDRLIKDVRCILRLDENLGEFYQQSNKQERLRWVAEMSAGRLLRSPTVWEDLVKTICTTNCSWSLTKTMVGNLVEKLGASAANGDRAFPDPQAMAAVDEGFYRDEIRAGYRSPYFLELAEAVASGKLDPERWLSIELPTTELRKEMKMIKGVGDYAADNLLKLVGRYDGLALDSWLRSQFYKKHNNGSVCDDKQIALFYEEFGCWRGLAIWCDMTEKWH